MIRWFVFRWRRFRYMLALFRHDGPNAPFKIGDPALGKGEQRRHNVRLLLDRHEKRAPKPEDFGLPKDFRP